MNQSECSNTLNEGGREDFFSHLPLFFFSLFLLHRIFLFETAGARFEAPLAD